MIGKQTFSERRSYERRSESRSQFHVRKVSAAHFLNHERKKSAAHFLMQERMMSAKVSKERKKSAENKFSKKIKHSIDKDLKFSLYQQHWSLKLHVLPIKGYTNEQKIRREYNLAKENERKMSAK